MDYRDPIVVIDETIDNLVYLVEWWLEDLDIAVARDFDLLTREDAKTISALRATPSVAATSANRSLELREQSVAPRCERPVTRSRVG